MILSRRQFASVAIASTIAAAGSEDAFSAQAQPPVAPPDGRPDGIAISKQPVLNLPARAIPVPAYLSPGAQTHLAAVKAIPIPPIPADNRAVWRGVSEMANRPPAQPPSLDGIASATMRDAGAAKVFVIDPQAKRRGEDTIYFDMHGGGLLGGGGELCRAAGIGLARARRMKVWTVDYRMPPAHPFPAALDDCIDAYRAALRDYPAHRIIVGGGSAGGNLAAALMLRAHDEGLPMPAGLVLISPELDLTESGDSFHTNAGLDAIASVMPINRLYAAGHDLAHPYLSPLFGKKNAFPPTLLTVGTRELFLSNTVRMHAALRAAGVYAELHLLDAGTHGDFGGNTPEDQAISTEIDRFIFAALRPGRDTSKALTLGRLPPH